LTRRDFPVVSDAAGAALRTAIAAGALASVRTASAAVQYGVHAEVQRRDGRGRRRRSTRYFSRSLLSGRSGRLLGLVVVHRRRG